jgi:endo-1,4-beta-xylanase
MIHRLYGILLSAGLSGCLHTDRAAPPSLAETYADSFRIGASLIASQITGEKPEEQKLINRQFNSYTASNEMKWSRIHPRENEYHFSYADALMELGERNNATIIGHTLVWHQQTPDWVFEDENGEPASRELLLARLKTHIDTVVGRYAGRVHGWDVINEAFYNDGSWRKTRWYEILGEDYIAQAFRMAHEADPEARLYYNDFNLYKPEKREAVLALIRDLRHKDVPIHGIGIQGHYELDHPPIDQIEEAIEAFGALGLEVMVTELDVSVLPFPDKDQRGADLSVNFELAAELNPYVDGLPDDVRRTFDARYRDLFALFLRHRDVISRVTFWNLSDSTSWKNNWPVHGRTDYPLLFDRQNQPKSAFYELLRLKQEFDAWRTEPYDQFVFELEE